jgi:cytochrome c oxidase assembly factor CtaG
MDIGVMLPAAVAVLLYARGLDRWTERTRPHPMWRSLSFFGGVLLIVLAVQTPLDALAEHHFAFHMIQHELLMMVAVPMLLLGAPTTPMLLGLPGPIRKSVVAPLARHAVVRELYRLLTHPVFALVASTAIVVVWHLVPGWYVEALRNGRLHEFEHATFVASGLLAWWPVIDPRPLHARLNYPARMAFLLALSTPRAFIAAFIAFSEEPLFIDWYGTVSPVFNITLAQDQLLGGLLMWLPSQLLYLAAMAATFFTWHAASEAGTRGAPTGERAFENASP